MAILQDLAEPVAGRGLAAVLVAALAKALRQRAVLPPTRVDRVVPENDLLQKKNLGSSN